MEDLTRSVNRRQFVTTTLASIGSVSFLTPSTAFASPVQETLTVQQVIDRIVKTIPGGVLQQTVDTLKAGSPDQPVTGIVSTMFATVDVIRKAIELKANFIIAHEPTFYNHLDDTAWLAGDEVYEYKKKLLDDNKIAVWRFHDYWHRHDPDGIRMGVLEKLGWDKYYDPKEPRLITIGPTPLSLIVGHVKNKLGIDHVRFIGDRDQLCRRIAIMPGASGGRSHISLLMQHKPDLLICGEVAEWETAEHVRDAIAMGLKRSLIVLGHAQSEEPGMNWLVNRLRSHVNDIRVDHIPANNPFAWS